jgi:DNA polymerase-4
MERSIFHLRLRNFEIQAERLADRQLRTRAIAIISSGNQNGTVIRLSEEAESEGLMVGMKVSVVRKMSHSVQLLNYNHRLYQGMNQQIYGTVTNFSPVVEPSKYGQFYLDMTGMNLLYKSNIQAGNTMLRDIQNKVELAGAVGISSNKLVSSTSTLTVPEPLYEIESGGEPGFMAPLTSGFLPVAKEKQVAKILSFLLLKKVKDIQGVLADPMPAAVLFGQFHRAMELQAYGKDYSEVSPPQKKPHILKHKVLTSTTNDIDILEAAVQNLVVQLGYDLREQKKLPKSLTLEINYSDGFTNSSKGRPDSNDDQSLMETCRTLFDRANNRRNRIRSILLDATDLKPFSRQLDLFDSSPLKIRNLSSAVDSVRLRFGESSIHSAAALLAG